ncbi:C2H2-type zinc finger transcription factor [Phycomyces blakesleeanus NRRL 1555(-)]|uniref:C2H2-type zinc finger transcription factor n=2 Tax=Phycomyces blakesleeanus TaxID=4837 RepID=A0A163DJB8_PHYB8|nr:C2H2-type zinc finger transcription factor [Phycomyces blakesleeanus NRRL 1555(-)]OAD71640.1 C2H2-type zinc finger transcription factor [Phycomyces blakesleeanus NRRL 1555(-)]|eukprot:XP_018289680.1 C2H2-type zinc finger transcription factor [Phycomyces blakesleeanus NRRL 1555(-)]
MSGSTCSTDPKQHPSELPSDTELPSLLTPWQTEDYENSIKTALVQPNDCSQFRIDGQVPRQNSMLAHSHQVYLQQNEQKRAGPGRRRLEGQKGLLMGLIDHCYPPPICPSCYYTGSSLSDIHMHYKLHSGVKAYRCIHPTCNHAYSSRPGLRYHLEHAHTVTMISDSSVQLVASKKSVTISKRPAPTRMKKSQISASLQTLLDNAYHPTLCPACQMSFKRKTHVVHHIVSAHRGDEIYKCVVSGCKRNKAYATREGLVYHLANYHS